MRLSRLQDLNTRRFPQKMRRCDSLLRKLKKKQLEKYYEDAMVKMWNINSYERCVYTRQNYLVVIC